MKFLRNLFCFRKKNIPERTIDELKHQTKVLFIDDQSFKIVKQIKEHDGWENTRRIRDVESLNQLELKEAHIVFVDVQGVGKKMGFSDEGLGLITAIRKQYPAKKIIMYSAESNGKIDGLHPASNMVDYRLRKTASRYEFASIIETYSKECFCLDNCIEHICEIFKQEFGINKEKEEVKRVLMELYNTGDYNKIERIEKAFNLDNIGSIASVIQLFFCF